MRSLFLLAVLLLVTAGCNQPTPSTTTPPTTSAPASGPPKALTFDNSADACVENLVLVLVDPAQAQKSLPPGFVAADASGFFGLELESGKALVWVNAYGCSRAQWDNASYAASELSILVTPRGTLAGNGTENVTLAPVDYTLYEVRHYSASERQLTDLNGTGYAMERATIDATYSTPNAALSIKGANGTLVDVTFPALASQALSGKARFWHVSPNGVAFTEFELKPTTMIQGAANACTLAGAFATVAGLTDCKGSAAITVPQQAWTSTFRFFPGAKWVPAA